MNELTIPVFPLPDVVFFPETVLPLHVFEPRYRRMIADCLGGDRWLAVATLRPGWERDYQGRPPIYAVAGAGEILQTERLTDGRFNILLHGRCRIRIEAEEPAGDRPYRVARACPLADVGAVPTSEDLRGLRGGHLRLLAALGQVHPELVSRLVSAGVPPGAVIDRIVSAVVPDAAVRQQVLETLDVSERLEVAERALADLLSMVAGSQGEEEEASGDA